ncbi:plasmid pRiA4b ORF-3 family protein [candidate division KSB1 bacterium]|nr:plasmid pRiA4b ORF-3 family protein [candidate division KSB1 bacterium]
MKKKNFYQLKVILKGSKPSIWRRILISSNTLLPDLHKILQITMGWTNSHLHQFIHKGIFFSEPDEEYELDCIDYMAIPINELLQKEGDKLIYEYDFGDGWEHEIILEKIIVEENNQIYPKCLEGKNSSPPEDCGGIMGYLNLLEVIADPNHEEYNELMEWLGVKFHPEKFDKNKVNEMLKADHYGLISLS